MNIQDIIAENRRRLDALKPWDYDPLVGDPADPARILECGLWLPRTMVRDPHYSPSLDAQELDELRFLHDFEYWCVKCVKIKDKVTSQIIPFVLNRPQRRLVRLLESERRAGRPIRVIMLKARQWGGSTLVQIYFAWIQIIHRRGWNSLICAHVKDSSSNIRGMYKRLLSNYPRDYWHEDEAPALSRLERTENSQQIKGRDCVVTVCSSENQEATRGMDFSMAHLSEVAFWRDSTLHNPLDLIRSVTSGIMPKPLSIIVMESTANGVGNYFHREWCRAGQTLPDGQRVSDKLPFFVPWFDIDIYREPVSDPEALWNSLDDYERTLWDTQPVTLEGLNWYHRRRREYQDHRSMMAEFPSTPAEAFTATSCNVFDSESVEKLRAHCTVIPEVGELTSGQFIPSSDGKLKVWSRPRSNTLYITAVDIGGRSAQADWSVITVIDRRLWDDGKPEVVAQWRGHIDHDLLGRKAAAISTWYGRALLVIESNTLESEGDGAGSYILGELSRTYYNLYRRPCPGGGLPRPGFHTNRATKTALIDNLIALVRQGGYTERDPAACDELLQYETLPGGGFAARRGCHDDMLMSRAIALWVNNDAPRSAHPDDIAALVRAQLG